MLSREENELIARVGPDTPGGRMLRCYWLPACWSEEVAERDGTPVRVRIRPHVVIAERVSCASFILDNRASKISAHFSCVLCE